MIVLNFSHPLTAEQLDAVAREAGARVESVLVVRIQLDEAQDFAPQARAAIQSADLSPTGWQTRQVVVVLPGYSAVAAVILAEIHGRSGHFPTIARLRPVAGSVPTRYELAELIDLQEIRAHAREAR